MLKEGLAIDTAMNYLPSAQQLNHFLIERDIFICIYSIIIHSLLFTVAADVAFDQMLQEDFSHPITRALSWYACHLYWKNPPAEVVDEAEDQEGGEEGEVLTEFMVVFFNMR
jgi:hypothetical protein